MDSWVDCPEINAARQGFEPRRVESRSTIDLILDRCPLQAALDPGFAEGIADAAGATISVVDRTVDHPQETPCLVRRHMRRLQSRGETVGIEWPGRSAQAKPFWQVGPVARSAVDLRASPRRPASRRRDPKTLLKRRSVANMLVVAARKLGDPVPSLILMEAKDHADHSTPSCSTGPTVST
jgi:hypothetical protein